jgi:hypothetical protein
MPLPLGLNVRPEGVMSVLPQKSEWRPNEFLRTGTFHKYLKGRWVSFGVETTVRASPNSDEILMQVRLTNRDQAPLDLTVLPEQTLFELDVPAVRGIVVDPATKFTQPDAYTLKIGTREAEADQAQVKVLSDLAPAPGGWTWTLAPAQEASAYFSIFARAGNVVAQDPPGSGIRERWEAAGRAAADRLRWAAGQIPSIHTANRQLDEFYYRSVLTIVENKWTRDKSGRDDFPTNPFYALSPDWLVMDPWDMSFISRIFAVLDPNSCREMMLLLCADGGRGMFQGYAQTLYANIQVIRDYLDQTGDTAIFDTVIAGSRFFDRLKADARGVIKSCARPDGLLEFGDTGRLLEMRTDGYDHVVATTNGLMAAGFRQVAAWCRARKDPAAAEFEQEASTIEQRLQSHLWNERAGWFENEFLDGSRQIVWSYHVFDLLGTGMLTDAQRLRMIGYLRDGVFLGPYGMYGIAKTDRVHWDWQDADWGGGGQFTGMPMRIVENLFAMGQAQLAWDILDRCTRWVSAYPYFPQEIYTDDMSTIEVGEQPLHICGGAAAQAVVFGVFGLRPRVEGRLEVKPAWNQSLGDAWLKGYRFRGHLYDVHLMELGFEVFRDGKLAQESPYTKSVSLQ